MWSSSWILCSISTWATCISRSTHDYSDRFCRTVFIVKRKTKQNVPNPVVDAGVCVWCSSWIQCSTSTWVLAWACAAHLSWTRACATSQTLRARSGKWRVTRTVTGTLPQTTRPSPPFSPCAPYATHLPCHPCCHRVLILPCFVLLLSADTAMRFAAAAVSRLSVNEFKMGSMTMSLGSKMLGFNC